MFFTLLLLLAADLIAADLNQIGYEHLARRADEIARIKTPDQARARQSEVRKRILNAIGGLPDYRGPLNARVTATTPRAGYTIENVTFESLPGLLVTANVYRPAAPGRYPAVLIPMGHWSQGKLAAQVIATNLALKGFVAMPYDPLGQGERLQAWDVRLGRSIGGGATDQHQFAGAQALLLGQSFARYRVHDARRGIDYLVSRPDVDAQWIGVTGCSGGGTVTTYVAALDDRVKAAAPACYMNSYRSLLSTHIGDAEQSLPGFLSAGLDEADYVELFAPKPWLIGSTEQDFFTPTGAKQVFDEAREWYRLFGAEDRIAWVVGPGGHGTPLKVREAIYGWMIRWLKDGNGDAREVPFELVPDHVLQVTPEGQTAAADILPFIRETRRTRGSSEELRAWIRERVPAPPVRRSAGDAGRPAMILATPNPELAGELERTGNVVLTLKWTGTGAPNRRPLVGEYETNTRAMMIGDALPLIRAREIVAAAAELANRPDVDAGRIGIYARGVAGVPALFAAAASEQIARVWLERTPYSYERALDTPVPQELFETVIPGFLLKWDLGDVAALAGPKRVVWTDPTDWRANVVKLPGDYRYKPSDANLGAEAFRPGF
ncbi:MAG TPA: acetylxylan esterase [Bryobacteraceae bacterium]|nr:acetylxylan esterase [Bryobacteraceae bacterium]